MSTKRGADHTTKTPQSLTSQRGIERPSSSLASNPGPEDPLEIEEDYDLKGNYISDTSKHLSQIQTQKRADNAAKIEIPSVQPPQKSLWRIFVNFLKYIGNFFIKLLYWKHTPVVEKKGTNDLINNPSVSKENTFHVCSQWPKKAQNTITQIEKACPGFYDALKDHFEHRFNIMRQEANKINAVLPGEQVDTTDIERLTLEYRSIEKAAEKGPNEFITAIEQYAKTLKQALKQGQQLGGREKGDPMLQLFTDFESLTKKLIDSRPQDRAINKANSGLRPS